MNQWTQVGAQMLRREDDLVFIRLCGQLNLAEAEELLAFLARVREQAGQLYLLFDGTQVAGIDPAVRRLFIEWNRKHTINAVANFGGGMMQRALAFLLNNAIRLVVNRTPPFTYVATEAQARSWLDAQRRQQRR